MGWADLSNAVYIVRLTTTVKVTWQIFKEKRLSNAMKKEITNPPSQNTTKLPETILGRNHQTNKLLIFWKISSFEKYLSWNYCFYCLTKPTCAQANTSYYCFLDRAVKPTRKNPLAYNPIGKSYLKLDKSRALLSFTVIQCLDFRIPRKYFLGKFRVWKCNEKFWTSWKQQ